MSYIFLMITYENWLLLLSNVDYMKYRSIPAKLATMFVIDENVLKTSQ